MSKDTSATIDDKQWVRPNAASKHFKVTTMTLYRWRQQEGFPQYIKRGRVILYNIAAIERWLLSK